MRNFKLPHKMVFSTPGNITKRIKKKKSFSLKLRKLTHSFKGERYSLGVCFPSEKIFDPLNVA